MPEPCMGNKPPWQFAVDFTIARPKGNDFTCWAKASFYDDAPFVTDWQVGPCHHVIILDIITASPSCLPINTGTLAERFPDRNILAIPIGKPVIHVVK